MTHSVSDNRACDGAGGFYPKSLLPLCLVALVLGYLGELAILAPNITLERGAAGGWAIGSSTAVQAFGIVVSGPLSALMLSRLSSAVSFLLGGFLCAGALAAIAIADGALAIAAGRFVFAIGLGLLLVVSQHVVTARAPVRTRATCVALFACCLSLGATLAPALIHATEPHLGPAYGVGLVLMLVAMACGAPVCRSGRVEPVTLRQTLRTASRIGRPAFLSGIVYGVLTNGLLALLAVYAMRVGYSVRDASTIVLVGLIGTFVLQIPLGWLCDRFPPCRVIGLCVGVMLGLLTLMALGEPDWPLFLLFAFALGGLCDVFYLVGVVEMTSRTPRSALASGNASFILACGLGEMIGPLLGGSALDQIGPNGFLAVFIAVLAGFLLARVDSPDLRRPVHQRAAA